MRHGAARRLAVCARRLHAASRSTLITQCLNLVAALRRMPQARWQYLNFSGAGQHSPDLRTSPHGHELLLPYQWSGLLT